MVQMNQMLNTMNGANSMQVKDITKAVKNDNGKSAFSDALDQEISAQEKPAADEKPDQVDSKKGSEDEAVQAPKQEKEQTEEKVEDSVKEPQIADNSWLVQNLVVQQPTDGQQMTVETDVTVTVETVLPQQDAEMVQTVVAETEAVAVAADVTQAEPVIKQAKAEPIVQNAGQQQVTAAETEQTMQVQVTAEDGDVMQKQADPNQQKQTVQVEEAKPATGNAEAVSQVNQQTTQQVGTEAPKAVQQQPQTQTVNVSNPQEGVPNLAKNMAEQIMQGKNTFEIWLEPANLGKIGVKVAYEGGRAMISIICMSDKAMEILGQNAKTLGAIVQQNTGTNTIVVVEQPEKQDYLQQNAEQQNRENNQEQQESKGKDNEQEAETQSFLQQLRLGLK